MGNSTETSSFIMNDTICDGSGTNLPKIPVNRLERWSIVKIIRYERRIIDRSKSRIVKFFGFRHHFLLIKILSGSETAYILTDFNGDNTVNCIYYLKKEKYLKHMVESNPISIATYKCESDDIFRDFYRLKCKWKNEYNTFSHNCRHYADYILENLNCYKA